MNISNFLNPIKEQLRRVGASTLYTSLLLYYAYRSSDTPAWAKHIITGALAYLLNPIDAIPDLTPFLGYTDDLSVLSFALVTVACYIDTSIRDKATKEISTWIQGDHSNEIMAINKLL